MYKSVMKAIYSTATAALRGKTPENSREAKLLDA